MKTSSLLTSPLFAVLVVVAAIALGSLVSPLLAAVLGGVATLVVANLAQVRLRRDLLASRDRFVEAQRAPVLPWLGFLDLVDEGLLVLDARRTVIYANRASEALLGRSAAALHGQPLIRAAWSSELARVVAEAEGVPREVALDGGRTLLASAHAAVGDPASTLVLLREVSDSRRADRSRTELVANLSHELRTPIAAARALAETLESGVEDETRRVRYQRQLLSEIDRLASIVDRTLRLSRIEAGAEPLDLVPLPPEQLVQAAQQRLAPLAEARGVWLRSGSTPDLPEVSADFDRAVEVLTLLLDNAVKFSPPGEPVVVSASRTDAGFVTFEVRDRGPGVLPADRERVFERLYTGDRARAAPAEGTTGFGLGLAIARHLVARMGGRIWVADVEGPGAAFRFTLPLARVE